MTALERKQQTEKLLKSLNIPYIDHLPLIEDEHEVRIRVAADVARRILVLTHLCYLAEVQDARSDVVGFLKSSGLWDSATPNEKELFEKELDSKEKVNISWRSEAIWLLLWVIKKVDKLELPKDEVSVSEILKRIPNLMDSAEGFIGSAEIRTPSEILDISDLTYRLHWATRNSDLDGSESVDLNSSIVYERHYAINWVTFYEDNWDDVTTDT